MKVEVQWIEGCPHAESARAMVHKVVACLAPDARIVETVVRDAEHAQRLYFQGSPSILVDSRDLEDRDEIPEGLACRVYAGGGPPPADLLKAALRRALAEEDTHEPWSPGAALACNCPDK